MKRRGWYARPWPIATVLAVLLGLWLARGPLLGPLVAHLVASTITTASGGTATVAQAGGGWLHDAHLSGLQAAGPGPEPLWRVKAGRVEARYGIGLLGGDLAALQSVDVTGLLVEITPDGAASDRGPAPWPALLDRLPATLPTVRVHGDVVLRLPGSEVRVTGLQARLEGDRLDLAMQRLVVNDREFLLPAVALRRSAPDTLSLLEPMRLDLPGLAVPLLCDQLDLTLGARVQQVTASGRLAGGRWQAAVTAESMLTDVQGVDAVALGLLPSALGPLLVDAGLERVAAGWRLRDVRVAGVGLRLRAAALLRGDPWRLDHLVAELDLEPGRLPGLERFQGRVRASLQGMAQLLPDRWRQSDLTLTITGSDVVYAGEPFTPLHGTLRIAEGMVGLEALEIAWSGVQATLAEALPESPAVAGPAAWHLRPRPIRLAGGTVQAEATLGAAGELVGTVRLDGLPLAGLPGLTALRHVQGAASGRLRLGGTVMRPVWDGVLIIDGLEAKLSPDVPTLTAGLARLAFSDGLVQIEELHGELGGSRLDVAGRMVLAESGRTLDLHLTGSNLLLVQRPDARVRADLDLRLGGPLEEPRLSGSAKVVSALFTPDLQFDGDSGATGDGRLVLFELPDPPWSLMRFDLQIGSTPPVQDGDGGVRVVTRWGRVSCDLDLRLGGTGAAPEPLGRVSVREGVATLPFSTLKVTHGELAFPTGDPFRPRITAIAEARIRQYDVQVQVTGPLDEPIVRISGSGLDEQEAMMLLTTGSTPRELQGEQGQRAAIGRMGAWLGQETWRSLQGSAYPDAGPSLTERLTIEWGRETTAQGRDTIDSEVELTTPGSDPAVLLYGERDRYDQYNAGIMLRLYWGGERP